VGYLTREYFVWFGLVILHSLERWMHMEIIVVAYDGEMMVMMVLFSGRISWMKRLQQFTPLKTNMTLENPHVQWEIHLQTVDVPLSS